MKTARSVFGLMNQNPDTQQGSLQGFHHDWT
jgi:hypothetical protein